MTSVINTIKDPSDPLFLSMGLILRSSFLSCCLAALLSFVFSLVHLSCFSSRGLFVLLFDYFSLDFLFVIFVLSLSHLVILSFSLTFCLDRLFLLDFLFVVLFVVSLTYSFYRDLIYSLRIRSIVLDVLFRSFVLVFFCLFDYLSHMFVVIVR